MAAAAWQCRRRQLWRQLWCVAVSLACYTRLAFLDLRRFKAALTAQGEDGGKVQWLLARAVGAGLLVSEEEGPDNQHEVKGAEGGALHKVEEGWSLLWGGGEEKNLK